MPYLTYDEAISVLMYEASVFDMYAEIAENLLPHLRENTGRAVRRPLSARIAESLADDRVVISMSRIEDELAIFLEARQARVKIPRISSWEAVMNAQVRVVCPAAAPAGRLDYLAAEPHIKAKIAEWRDKAAVLRNTDYQAIIEEHNNIVSLIQTFNKRLSSRIRDGLEMGFRVRNWQAHV